MLIIGTFEYSIELEQALAELEYNGIPREKILVVPMATQPHTSNKFMTKLSDYYSKGIEVGIACATALSVIGTSVGFILALGPIFWGLTTALVGFSIGFGIYILSKKGVHRRLPKKLPEVIVIIQGLEDKVVLIKETMWKYCALTVGQTSDPT